MFRYLLNISYIGTNFRGVQRLIKLKEDKVADPLTVQGQMEIALNTLNPINRPVTTASSRTDSGVHALQTTMHVDLERTGGRSYEPEIITIYLNTYFTRNNISIRVLKTYLVPADFHCRHKAISRTYLYRLVVLRSAVEKHALLQHFPMQEYDRSLFVCANVFDLNQLREAAELFVGYHDFRTFMHKSVWYPHKVTRRVIEKLEIEESKMFYSDVFGFPSCVDCNESDYTAYNVTIKAKGFLYKQVRRTVACLIAVAKGIVTPRDIKLMLEIPSHRSWNPRIRTLPAQGLYLCKVEYSAKDLETFKA